MEDGREVISLLESDCENSPLVPRLLAATLDKENAPTMPDATKNTQGQSPNPGSKAAGKRKASVLSPRRQADDSDSDDDQHALRAKQEGHGEEDGSLVDAEDVMEVERPSAGAPSSSAAAQEEPVDEDGDVAFVGRSGALALVDFPHAREYCFLKTFCAGKEHERCPNCFCFVCEYAPRT